MKRIFIAILLTAAALAAQDAQGEKQAPKPMVQRLFILKYAEPAQVATLLGVFNANIRQNAELHALTVEASPEAMRGIEDAIQKLDVASASPRNVEMTIYLMLAADSAAAGQPVPKDLDPVVTQLKNAFPFKNYGLLDTLNFRTRTGQRVDMTSSGASLQVGSRQVPIGSQIQLDSLALAPDGVTLRVNRLRANFRVPVANGAPGDNQYTLDNLGLQTDLDIKEGQKVVVGRLGLSHDQALFLVMTARVL